jgi:hypothetical protein
MRDIGAEVCILRRTSGEGWMLVDHIIYAAPDLDSAVDDLERRRVFEPLMADST